MSQPPTDRPIKIFYSYSHEDERLLKQLLKHLAILRRQRKTIDWHDRKIQPGTEWGGAIDENLESASIILLLVSASFIDSDYCNDVELKRALERHEAGEARVIPVILRPCHWEESPFGKLQALPKDGLAVIKWKPRDEGFKNIAEGIEAALEEWLKTRPQVSPKRRTNIQKVAQAVNHKINGSEARTKPFNNLSTPLTRFIGRETEMADIQGYLRQDNVRVVVINGIGGAGKSRLAQKAAADSATLFKDGVCLVLLERISDPDLVIATISQTLGLREVEGVSVEERLKHYLSGRQMLLLLDNFEHVIAAAEHITDLLLACPDLKMLLTSRKALNMAGFINYRVPPLKLPPRKAYRDVEALSQYDAVQLFIDSAKVVDRRFKITDDNAPAVAEICVRLDGLPLAIELAAARVDLFSPEEMLTEMEHQLDFFVKSRVVATWLKRHETMRATIAWSYDLLDKPGEKTLFKRLSVFKDGCTIEATRQVCNARGDLGIDLSEGLQSLLENNLLRRYRAGSSSHRFTMPDMIREYGIERLMEDKSEESATRLAHAEFFRDLAERAEKKITSAERGNWLELLEEEHGNFQAVLVWCQTEAGDSELGLRLAGALFWFWNLRAHFTDGRTWLEGTLIKNRESKQTAALAKALYGAGGLAFLLGDYGSARKRLEESVAIWRGLKKERELALALVILGMTALSLGDFETALACETESVRIFHEIKDKWGCALSLNDLGNVYRINGEYTEAFNNYSKSLKLWREMNDAWGMPLTLSNMGFLDLLSGKYATARRSLKKALAVQRRVGDKLGLAATLKYLGDLAVRQANKRLDPKRRADAFVEAAKYYGESLMLNRELEHKQFMIASLTGLATVVGQTTQQPEQAAQLFGATDLFRHSFAVPEKDVDQEMYESGMKNVRAQFNNEKAFEKARARGQRMNLDDVITYALELAPK